MASLIEIRNMCKIYNPGENEVRALDHVSLSIGENEFVAIIGHSGSGKSTLMNMLGCLDVPTSGIYLLHGSDVSLLSDDELSDIRNQEIGFIFQGFNLISNLTAFENVELPLIYRGVSKKERTNLAKEALRKVGLENRMTHKPSEMSGGQQQRVAIARAIAQAPPVILADEPTGNLDSHSSQEIMNILKQLHAEGRTVIVITHDNDIAANAKRIIHIEDGRITSDSANEGNLSRDDIDKEIRSGPVVYDSDTEEEIPNEEPTEAVIEEPAGTQDDFDIKITDENIDLHLIGERQNEQEE
ncbi:MAG: ABC transporter ATP-binding protein [Lachnospiraceae bacterium]|nr:ABC transporter ATP-binding protein [Lachnospiraceae bacterium]